MVSLTIIILRGDTMSKQVKCKHCKKSIDKESAYKEEYLTSSLAIRYRYYCNEDCYNESVADKLNKELDKAKLKDTSMI